MSSAPSSPDPTPPRAPDSAADTVQAVPDTATGQEYDLAPSCEDPARGTVSESAGSLSTRLRNLPTSPGVYLFKNAEGTVIYVGKAKSLRPRVRSYFQERQAPDPKKEMLVSKITDLDLIVTDSEVEALLLENTLIKQHSPRYNMRLKDDKSYPYIVVTQEPFPRVFPTRRVLRDGSRYYGPYSDVKAMHAMLRTIRGIFPVRSCDYPLSEATIERKRYALCLDYHIQKCEGPCEGLVDRTTYATMIQQIEQLLKGKTRSLQMEIETRMRDHSMNLEFEKAAIMRNRLLALQKYQERQKVVFGDFADRDIVGMAWEDNDAVGVVFRVRDGKIVGKHHLSFTGVAPHDSAALLESVLTSYYSRSQDFPPDILLPEPLPDDSAVPAWLQEIAGMNVELTVPKIGDKAKLSRMCQANARFLLDDLLLQRQKLEEKTPASLLALQRDLHLATPPRRIECFDISHFQGDQTVASMVSFLEGKPRKREYRKFLIQSVQGVDDFASMREVVGRRYRRLLEEGTELPDLIMVDGGKGQLSAAMEALAELGLEQHPTIGLAKRLEEVFLPGERDAQNIPKTSPGLRLLQRIRDEAHRFAITFHRERRDKAVLRTALEDIEGVGPKKATRLLTTFGSVRGVAQATPEALAEIVGWSTAKAIAAWIEANGVSDLDPTDPSDRVEHSPLPPEDATSELPLPDSLS